jgi:hypothetical protein
MEVLRHMTFCSRPVLWLPEVHASDLLELAALSGTGVVKRKAKERFWKYCLTPSLSGVFTGPVTALGWRRMKLLRGFHRTSLQFPIPSPLAILSGYRVDV